MTKSYLVTGCGTEVGKTVVASILTKAQDANYWKPIQCGSLDCTDAQIVEKLTGKKALHSSYLFPLPISPHLAAKQAGVVIEKKRLHLFDSQKPLVVEGAGGVFVPLTNDLFYIDLFSMWQLPVVFVSRHYLGSINHTLLSFEALQRCGLQIEVLVFNGAPSPVMEEVMIEKSGAKYIFHLNQETINQETVEKYAERWRGELA